MGEPGQVAFEAYWETPNARWDQMSNLGKAKWAQAETKILDQLGRERSDEAGAAEKALRAVQLAVMVSDADSADRHKSDSYPVFSPSHQVTLGDLRALARHGLPEVTWLHPLAHAEVTVAVAQLRHAFTKLHEESVVQQRELAHGLIAPQIERLERLLHSGPADEVQED